MPSPGGGVEVLLGGAERYLASRSDGPPRPAPRDQPEVEGGVGQHVDHGRAGRQHPVLHPQVRAAVHDVVDRPVPPVDGAVVQPQLAQLRHAAGVQDLDRVLVVADRQQRREVADVLLEQVEDRGDPALAEPDPRAVRPGPSARPAGCRWPARTGRSGSPPRAACRTGTASSPRPRPAPRRSPGRRSSSRRSCPGATCRWNWRLVQAASGAIESVCGLQPFDAADVELDVLAPGADDLVVEHAVARVGGEVVQRPVWRSVSVGRMPIRTIFASDLAARSSARAEAAAQVLLVVGEAVALDQPGRRR